MNHGFTRLVCVAVLSMILPLVVSASAGVEQSDTDKSTSTADHGKFEALQQEFKTGPDVTKACLTCHTEASKQLHQTKHWNWKFTNPSTGQTVGKQTVINNFCLSVTMNEPRCTSCHIGYGWTDDSFDFTSEESVDCLVCHDTTGVYRKEHGGGGAPHPALATSKPTGFRHISMRRRNTSESSTMSALCVGISLPNHVVSVPPGLFLAPPVDPTGV